FGFILWFAWKKQFYLSEIIMTCALLRLVYLFGYSMSEAMMLPFVFVFLFVGRKVIVWQLEGWKAFFWLSFMLILLFNIRYPGLFFMATAMLFGLINRRKRYGPAFIFSGITGFVFVVIYKLTFID